MDRNERKDRVVASQERGKLGAEQLEREKAVILAAAAIPPAAPRRLPPAAPPPSSGMVWAVLTAFFCFLPFGLVAIANAARVDGLWFHGYEDAARAAAHSARNWASASLLAGIALGLVALGVAL